MTYKYMKDAQSHLLLMSRQANFFNLSYWKKLKHLITYSICMVMMKMLIAIEIGAIYWRCNLRFIYWLI